MSDKLTKADALAKAVRRYFDGTCGDGRVRIALAAYEAAPAETVGDVRILINALKEIEVNEDRGNLDGDSADTALEQCNAMAEEALDDYEKSKEKTP